MMRWKGVVTQWLGYTYHEGSFNVVVCACAATIVACASRLAWRYTNDVELTLIVTMAVTATVGMQLVRIWVDNKIRDNLIQSKHCSQHIARMLWQKLNLGKPLPSCAWFCSRPKEDTPRQTTKKRSHQVVDVEEKKVK